MTPAGSLFRADISIAAYSAPVQTFDFVSAVVYVLLEIITDEDIVLYSS